MEIPYTIFILPFLGGYIFVRFWNFTRINTLRADKDRTVIRSSIAGLSSVIFVYFLHIIGSYFIPCRDSGLCIPTIWKSIAPFDNLGIPIAAFLVAATAWFPLNRWWFDQEREINRAINQDADPLEMMLKRAKDESLAVSITMVNEKVYIGAVTQPFNPVTPTTNIQLVPLQSGHRDPETKEMHLTINYSKTIELITKELDTVAAKIKELEGRRAGSLKDDVNKDVSKIESNLENQKKEFERLETTIGLFVLVIPVNQIASANIFDSDVHTRYFLPAPV